VEKPVEDCREIAQPKKLIVLKSGKKTKITRGYSRDDLRSQVKRNTPVTGVGKRY